MCNPRFTITPQGATLVATSSPLWMISLTGSYRSSFDAFLSLLDLNQSTCRDPPFIPSFGPTPAWHTRKAHENTEPSFPSARSRFANSLLFWRLHRRILSYSPRESISTLPNPVFPLPHDRHWPVPALAY